MNDFNKKEYLLKHGWVISDSCNGSNEDLHLKGIYDIQITPNRMNEIYDLKLNVIERNTIKRVFIEFNYKQTKPYPFITKEDVDRFLKNVDEVLKERELIIKQIKIEERMESMKNDFR